MASFIPSLSVIVLVISALQVFSAEPNVNWEPFKPNGSYFLFPITSFDGKEFCAPYFDQTLNRTAVLCETEARNQLYELNKEHGDDYDQEHTTSECTEAGDIPKTAKKVCWLRVQRGSWRKLGFSKKTDVEIQLWNEGDKKIAMARYSRPYDD